MKGFIYRIVSLSHPEIQYIGSSTTTIAKRWYIHKIDYEKGLKCKKHTISIYPYFQEYGIDDFKLILIKYYEVVDKKHLSSYEQLYINRCKCVNKVNPWSVSSNNCKWIEKEYRRLYGENNKEAISTNKKKYYINNVEEILVERKDYYQNNKEKIANNHIEYRQNNKELIAFKNKEYNNKNKEAIALKTKEKIQCLCGVFIVRTSKSRHILTDKHKNAL